MGRDHSQTSEPLRWHRKGEGERLASCGGVLVVHISLAFYEGVSECDIINEIEWWEKHNPEACRFECRKCTR